MQSITREIEVSLLNHLAMPDPNEFLKVWSTLAHPHVLG
jgi:hypothetical protein